jgi:hypothetical protein
MLRLGSSRGEIEKEAPSVKRLLFGFMTFAVAMLIASVSPAHASSGGIWDRAQQGCVGCHGAGASPTYATIAECAEDGSCSATAFAPEGGYVPGKTYLLRAWVIGAAPPFPVSTYTNIAGFNLEVTGGSLATTDLAQIMNFTECTTMEREFGCTPGSATNDCKVVKDPDCPAFDVENAECRKCGRTMDPALCRPCDSRVVLSTQATHTSDGNKQLWWDFRWTAPVAGSGPVTFYLAGNAVNGNGVPDQMDMPALMAPFAIAEKK